MKKKFPQSIYVKYQTDSDTTWMNAAESLFDLAELGEKVRVGVYKLVEVREIETVINAETVKQ